MDRNRMLELIEGRQTDPDERHPAGDEMDVLAVFHSGSAFKKDAWPGFVAFKKRMSYMQPALAIKVLLRMLRDKRIQYSGGNTTWDAKGSVEITPKGKKWFEGNLDWWT